MQEDQKPKQIIHSRISYADFFEIRKIDEEIIIIPKNDFKVGDSIVAKGTELHDGILEAGIDFHLYKDRDIAVESDQNGEPIKPYNLLGFFPNENNR